MTVENPVDYSKELEAHWAKATAKATASERAAINNAQLPGGGGGASGDDTVLSLEDIRDPGKVSDEDLKAMIEDAEITDIDRF